MLSSHNKLKLWNNNSEINLNDEISQNCDINKQNDILSHIKEEVEIGILSQSQPNYDLVSKMF